MRTGWMRSAVLAALLSAEAATACRVCTETLEALEGSRLPTAASPAPVATTMRSDRSLSFLRRLYEMDRIEKAGGRNGAEYAALAYQTLGELTGRGEPIPRDMARIAARLYRESLGNPHFVASERRLGSLADGIEAIQGKAALADVSRLAAPQRERLDRLFRLLDLKPTTRDGRLKLTFTDGRDGALSDRLAPLLARADFSPERFNESLNGILDVLDPYIVERASAKQISELPFVYRRWQANLIPGDRALRNADTFVFQDPTGTVSIIHLPERPLGEGTVMPAEVEVIRKVRDSAGNLVLDEERSFFKRTANGEESTRGRACMQCHRLGGSGILQSLTKRRNVEGLNLDLAHRTARGASVFIAADEIRGTPFSAAVRDLSAVPLLRRD